MKMWLGITYLYVEMFQRKITNENICVYVNYFLGFQLMVKGNAIFLLSRTCNLSPRIWNLSNISNQSNGLCDWLSRPEHLYWYRKALFAALKLTCTDTARQYVLL